MAVSTCWFINKTKKTNSINAENLTEKQVHLTRIGKIFSVLSNNANFPEFDIRLYWSF